MQDRYYILDLIFSLCVDEKLFLKGSDEKNRIRLMPTKKLEEFKINILDYTEANVGMIRSIGRALEQYAYKEI